MNKESFKVACIQLNSLDNVEKNIRVTKDLIIKSVELDQAEFIFTPENTSIMIGDYKKLLQNSFFEDDDPTIRVTTTLALKYKIWISIGSIPIKINNENIVNRSYLINPSGEIVCFYDKIHMFDVQLSKHDTYKESKRFQSGKKLKIAMTPWGKIGLSICYDVRFPNLYRSLASNGSIFLSIPSAFTKYTGVDHWHTLVKARAIENGCFVFAAAQCGEHYDGRRTYGHSLIVSPWGKIMAEANDSIGYIVSKIRLSEVVDVRKKLPVLDQIKKIE